MKRMKFASVAAAFILAGVAALGSGCAANSGKLSDPQDDVKLSSYEITALRGYTPLPSIGSASSSPRMRSALRSIPRRRGVFSRKNSPSRNSQTGFTPSTGGRLPHFTAGRGKSLRLTTERHIPAPTPYTFRTAG